MTFLPASHADWQPRPPGFHSYETAKAPRTPRGASGAVTAKPNDRFEDLGHR